MSPQWTNGAGVRRSLQPRSSVRLTTGRLARPPALSDRRNDAPHAPLRDVGTTRESAVLRQPGRLGERERNKVSLDDYAVRDLAAEQREVQQHERARDVAEAMRAVFAEPTCSCSTSSAAVLEIIAKSCSDLRPSAFAGT
jgi:hypothetical protein